MSNSLESKIGDCRKVVGVPVEKVFRRIGRHKLITQGKKPERNLFKSERNLFKSERLCSNLKLLC